MSNQKVPVWKIIVPILILIITSEALEGLGLSHNMARTISWFIASQVIYFMLPKQGINYRKYTLVVASWLLWEWLIMGVLFDLLEPHLPLPSVFLITLGITLLPLVILWRKYSDKKQKDNNSQI